MCGSYFISGSNLEKYGNFWKNDRFSGRIWPNWVNTTLTEFGRIGVYRVKYIYLKYNSKAVCRNELQ